MIDSDPIADTVLYLKLRAIAASTVYLPTKQAKEKILVRLVQAGINSTRTWDLLMRWRRKMDYVP